MVPDSGGLAKEEGNLPRMVCPKCGSKDTRRSRIVSLYGRVLSRLGRKPFRCRSCRTKFYRIPTEKLTPPLWLRLKRN
jgi:hypothetical protein